MQTESRLHSVLKQYFGFDSFRPLQEEIIRDALSGRDTFALLPTGGGKSLCFQLPALLQPGLTVVVSPLISLMKDQVDALQTNGIPATFLNSSLPPQELASRARDLQSGAYRLLYVAPERLMLGSFLSSLGRLDVRLIAIDEAHSISEWGHDFRREYRQLARLREFFPKASVMALTATATERVRDDVIAQMQLRNPGRYVASFNRANLTYRVEPKRNAYERVLAFVRERPGDSGIVYCQSRRGAESLAERLGQDGVKARPYHAGLPPEERSRHQDQFSRDEVQVVCATIAFGMGIDKPNVRFVLHYDLPKSIESYYQETGRSGRDGLPADCLLLLGRGDAVKYERFIDEKPDPKEQEVARQQLDQMLRYAESRECRRRQLLRYFGEQYPDESCDACDNCLSPHETADGTADARRLLACVDAIRKRNGFGVGMAHTVDVLVGANTEKARRWGHTELTVYGTGSERAREEWSAIGRDLIEEGLLRQGDFKVLELTPSGREVLAGQRSVQLPIREPPPAVNGRARTAADFDGAVFERLRALRKKLADERAVPPFVIFSDVALRQMSRDYPQDERQFLRISGVGDKKLRDLGAVFLAEIRDYLRTNARRTFSDDGPSPVVNGRARLNDSQADSLRRFSAGQTVPRIAQERGFAATTILGHLAAAVEAGEAVDISGMLSPEQQAEISAAFARLGAGNLAGVRESLGERYDYGLLRLYRATIQATAARSP